MLEINYLGKQIQIYTGEDIENLINISLWEDDELGLLDDDVDVACNKVIDLFNEFYDDGEFENYILLKEFSTLNESYWLEYQYYDLYLNDLRFRELIKNYLKVK